MDAKGAFPGALCHRPDPRILQAAPHVESQDAKTTVGDCWMMLLLHLLKLLKLSCVAQLPWMPGHSRHSWSQQRKSGTVTPREEVPRLLPSDVEMTTVQLRKKAISKKIGAQEAEGERICHVLF
eukprot:s2531_g14.t1